MTGKHLPVFRNKRNRKLIQMNRRDKLEKEKHRGHISTTANIMRIEESPRFKR